ncbi:MAG: ABC transporter permease [Caldilineaceae bacterium]|nr:ABC transporter permease [Caldilineaceae bacterium]MCY4118223.1 ABC transporter permease [Caldilineaceae bacterium]MDE0069971.1 ABC transporter permease [Caldilineaceae bacterium]
MAAVDLANTLQEPGRDSVQQRFWRRLIRHRLGMIGLVMLVILVVSAVFAPLIAGIDPAVTDLRNKNEPPSAEHILGTDAIGRDVWARLVYGARVSLSVGLVAVGIYTSIALVLGSVSGFFGGLVDGVIMRFTDVIMCFPTFLLILTAVAVLPPNIFNIMVIIGIFGWPGMTRLIRGQFLSLRSQDFVTAAVATGVPTRRIIFRHILPNVVGPVVVAATLGLAGAILTESSLSFLGLGVQQPTPSWGQTLTNALMLPVLENMPWRWLPSAIAIAFAVLSMNFFGDALRDAFDPRTNLD